MASGRESDVMSSVNQEFQRKLFLLIELFVTGVKVVEQLTFECLLRIFLGCLTDRCLRNESKEKMHPREDFWGFGSIEGKLFFLSIIYKNVMQFRDLG